MNPSLMQDRQRQMMDGRMQHGYQMDNMNNMNIMNMDNMNMMDRMNMDRMNMDRMSNMDNMNMGRTNLNMMNMDRMTNGRMDMDRKNIGHQMNRFKREADSDVVRYSTMTETPFQRSQTSVYYEDTQPRILMQTPRPMYLTNGYMPYVTGFRPSSM